MRRAPPFRRRPSQIVGLSFPARREVDLLAVKGVLRRERVYREAVLCVVRSADGDLQAVPVIDGRPSAEQ